MTQIKLDSALASKLEVVGQTVELCDPAGRVIGHFVPHADLSEWEPVTPDVSDEELDRRERANEKRYTTAAVLDHLKNL